MDVLARPAAGREVSPGDFGDITGATVTAIDWADAGLLRVVFDADLTDAEQMRVRLRIMSADADEESVRVESAAFLEVAEPTLAEVTAQARRLTCLLLSISD